MKQILCPLNGLRNVDEFAYGGEVLSMPAPDAPDGAWQDYIFNRANQAGVVREWWLHLPSSYWFILERNTVTDVVVRSYRPDELFGVRIDFSPPPVQ